jgi:hypothetical protein
MMKVEAWWVSSLREFFVTRIFLYIYDFSCLSWVTWDMMLVFYIRNWEKVILVFNYHCVGLVSIQSILYPHLHTL